MSETDRLRVYIEAMEAAIQRIEIRAELWRHDREKTYAAEECIYVLRQMQETYRKEIEQKATK